MKNPVIRSTPVVYGIAWALVIGFVLPFGHARLIAAPTAVAYASMHIYEISRRGHCYLSADSTAALVSALVYVSAIFTTLICSGHASHEDLNYVAAFSASGGALLLGHAAFAWSVKGRMTEPSTDHHPDTSTRLALSCFTSRTA